MDLNEPYTYAMSLAPIQVLLMLDETELKHKKFFERREVKKVREAFKHKSIKELISYQLQDYRAELLTHLLYLESAEYLLSLQDLKRCTGRQLLLLREYVFRFAVRTSNNIVKRIAKIMTLNIQVNSSSYNNIGSLSLSDHYKLSNELSKLIHDQEFKTEHVTPFIIKDFSESHSAFPVRESSELIDLFTNYSYVSLNCLEAKSISVGLGLHPSTNWPKVQDYHTFIELYCNRIPNVLLFADQVEQVLTCKTVKPTHPCVICFQRNIETIHVPCYHASICMSCSEQQMKIKSNCVVCRTDGKYVKMFLC